MTGKQAYMDFLQTVTHIVIALPDSLKSSSFFVTRLTTSIMRLAADCNTKAKQEARRAWDHTATVSVEKGDSHAFRLLKPPQEYSPVFDIVGELRTLRVQWGGRYGRRKASSRLPARSRTDSTPSGLAPATY